MKRPPKVIYFFISAQRREMSGCSGLTGQDQRASNFVFSHPAVIEYSQWLITPPGPPASSDDVTPLATLPVWGVGKSRAESTCWKGDRKKT